jgi:hypothetical protein
MHHHAQLHVGTFVLMQKWPCSLAAGILSQQTICTRLFTDPEFHQMTPYFPFIFILELFHENACF